MQNNTGPNTEKTVVNPLSVKLLGGVILAVFFLSLIVGGALFKFISSLYGSLPTPEELSSIKPSLVTRVYAADSSVIHEFHVERRFWKPIDEMPDKLKQAVVAIEDRRFYNHWGIDIKRIFGAATADIIQGEITQGASTLTQQLARNAYYSSDRTFVRKIREVLTSVKLETFYTKEEILELYLNMVYLGAGVYGVEAASNRYFSKSCSELNLSECAVLAGCIQLPEHYRPDKDENRKRTRTRRASVLRGMLRMGYISKQEYKENIDKPIPSNPMERGSGTAPYFVEKIRSYMEKRYGEEKLYNGGLNIYTTLDPAAQDSAERKMTSHLSDLQKRTNRLFVDSNRVYRDFDVSRGFFLEHFDSLYALKKDKYEKLPDSLRLREVQGAAVAMDVETGAVKLLIGGKDFSESKFNRALNARRQPGSSFKPFVYATAISKGYNPSTIVMDQPITLETPDGPWRPENYDHEFGGPTTLREGLRRSVNLVALQILTDIGITEVISFARNLGLKHHLPAVPSIGIGSCEATPIEMARAYSVFPGKGYQPKPYFIESVVDQDGRILEEHEVEQEKKISPQLAYMMCNLMSSVVRAGTGASIPRKGFTRPAGGKTGTTNDCSDAWFVGYTPQYACAVWVGIDERRSMGSGVTGAKGAIPIWVSAMKGLHKDKPVKKFSRPSGIVSKEVCEESYKVATDYCPETYSEIFMPDSSYEKCDVHGPGSKKNKNIFDRFGAEKKESTRGKRLQF